MDEFDRILEDAGITPGGENLGELAYYGPQIYSALKELIRRDSLRDLHEKSINLRKDLENLFGEEQRGKRFKTPVREIRQRGL